MTEADKAFVKQSEAWIENQENAIDYNDFLIDAYKQQIEFLNKRIESESAERIANWETLQEYRKQLKQFIEERQ